MSRGSLTSQSTRLPKIVTAAIGILLTAAPASALTPLPPQSDGVAWPTKSWETGPVPAGTDKGALDVALAEPFDGEPDAYRNTSAVVATPMALGRTCD
jgi:hypothetical protein